MTIEFNTLDFVGRGNGVDDSSWGITGVSTFDADISPTGTIMNPPKEFLVLWALDLLPAGIVAEKADASWGGTIFKVAA